MPKTDVARNIFKILSLPADNSALLSPKIQGENVVC